MLYIERKRSKPLLRITKFLFVAGGRQICKRNHEHQLNQAACLNLVVNAITVWNTVYMQAALEQLKNEGYEIKEDDVKGLSPARSEHINTYGKYYFDIEEELRRKGLRELKNRQANSFGNKIQ